MVSTKENDIKKDESNDSSGNITDTINNAKSSGFHYKTWLISGLGFFTDAYDLFIIGIVSSLIIFAGWSKLSSLQTSLLDSTALLSAVLGALVFGRLLDKLGRKAIYGLELVLLVTGALGSAFLTPFNSIYVLIAWRFLLGVGIGGDYATSSVIMSEYSNTKSRGKFVGMVFSMQSLGLLVGPLITLAFLFGHVSPWIAWRSLLAIGAIPAAIVIYYRRKMPETPKYTARAKGDEMKAASNLQAYTGLKATETGENEEKVRHLSWIQILTDWRLLGLVIGTAGSWFLMDWALYGNSIMSSQMTSALVPSSITGIAHLIRSTEYSALIFGVAALPGYWLATFTMDRIGRKTIQLTGFSMMALSFGILALFPQLLAAAYVVQFLILYGISYFFIEFGPNVTTFVYPPEVFPVTARGTGAGMAAAGGKTGAFIGTFLDVFILALHNGEILLFGILAIFALAGFIVTLALLPEPKRKSLEESSNESRYLAPH
ncbi:MAG: MFS transporter [Thermoplasmata archaeon]